MRNIGERIQWRGMNRTESGVIEEAGTVLRNSERPGYLVRLDNGKQVIVLDESILE